MNTFYAYIHARPDGTPFYIGKGRGRRATDFVARNAHHKNITAKYGIKNILVSKHECSSEEFAFALEVGMIKCFKRMGVTLVNMTDGGEGPCGAIVSAETRAKMSASRTGKKLPPHSDERRAKNSASKKGKPGHLHTPESRAKLIANHKGMTGLKHSEESRIKIGLASKGYVHTDEARAKMSAAQQGRIYVAPSDEARAKMSAAGKGRAKSESHRAKISAANKGKAKSAEHIAKCKATKAKKRELILGGTVCL